jgi:hypothetical protein
MGKFAKISVIDATNSIDIDINQFNTFVSLSETDDKETKENYLLLALPQGKWCRVNSGIAFEITSFNKETNEPGYIVPRGNGCCDIYSETGETNIKLTLYPDKDCSYGTVKNINQLGPFHCKNTKSLSQTTVYYFNCPGNFKDVQGDSLTNIVNTTPLNHLLMVNKNIGTLFINDKQDNAYKKFIGKSHWKEIYADKIDFKNNDLFFSSDFITKKEQINITDFLPENVKISTFICRKQLNQNQIGAQLELSNGNALNISYQNPDNDVMYFSLLNAMFLFIPKHPTGVLLDFHTPINLFANGVQVIGEQVNHVRTTNLTLPFFRNERNAEADKVMNDFIDSLGNKFKKQ